MTCIFCSIVTGESPAIVVDEDEHTMAFLAIHPANPGHTLVVPRSHADDIFDITSESLAAVAESTRRVAHLLNDRLRPDGMNIVQNSRRAAWQSVFHLHVHVIPRTTGDGLMPPWIERVQSYDDLSEVGQLLGARRQ